MTIIKREAEAMGHFHVCDAYAAPCDDPESQLDLSNGAKDRENFQRGEFSQGAPSENLPGQATGQATFGHGSVERSPLMCAPGRGSCIGSAAAPSGGYFFWKLEAPPAEKTQTFTIALFSFYRSFLSSFYGIFFTDARFFLFPAILVAQLLMGALGNTPPIWVWCLGTFSAVILSRWILYSVWGPGPLRKDYTPAFLCFLCAYLRYALQDPLFA